MPFSCNPTTVDAGILSPGQTVDVPVSFTGVMPDASAGKTVTFVLDGAEFGLAVNAVVARQKPAVTGIDSSDVPEVAVTVVDLTPAGATIRVSYA